MPNACSDPNVAPIIARFRVPSNIPLRICSVHHPLYQCQVDDFTNLEHHYPYSYRHHDGFLPADWFFEPWNSC
jgi:hypothetical protein